MRALLGSRPDLDHAPGSTGGSFDDDVVSLRTKVKTREGDPAIVSNALSGIRSRHASDRVGTGMRFEIELGSVDWVSPSKAR